MLNVLMRHDSLRVQEIARKAKLNRTTAYGIIKELAEKGLATATSRFGITEYQAVDPALLPSYLERQEEALRQNKKNVQKLIPELEGLRTSKKNLPQIYFFEGREGLKQAYEDTIENNREKVIRDFTGPDAMFEAMDEKRFVNYYVAKRRARGIKSISIFPDTRWSRWMKSNDKQELRETKLIPKEYAFDTGITIYDDRVAFMSYSLEHPLAVIIEDQNISATMKKLFSYINDHIAD